LTLEEEEEEKGDCKEKKRIGHSDDNNRGFEPGS